MRHCRPGPDELHGRILSIDSQVLLSRRTSSVVTKRIRYRTSGLQLLALQLGTFCWDFTVILGDLLPGTSIRGLLSAIYEKGKYHYRHCSSRPLAVLMWFALCVVLPFVFDWCIMNADERERSRQV